MSAVAIDRAAAVRQALRTLVAERGFHGASMSAVAAAAGVATGTAYTHYGSKDDLVLATYLETKAQLGVAATAGVDPAAPPEERFRAIWIATYRHLTANPDHALFLLQVDSSPYRACTREAVMARADDPILAAAAAADMVACFLALPLEILYELGLAPAVRLAATQAELSDAELETTAAACWRAVTR